MGGDCSLCRNNVTFCVEQSGDKKCSFCKISHFKSKVFNRSAITWMNYVSGTSQYSGWV